MRELKARRVGKILISGILPVMEGRKGYRNCRRMSINSQLEGMCRKEKVGFVEAGGGGGEIYAYETGTISANKLLAHRPISSNINRIIASHSGLKCVNLNARSIVSKMDELRRMSDIIGKQI